MADSRFVASSCFCGWSYVVRNCSGRFAMAGFLLSLHVGPKYTYTRVGTHMLTQISEQYILAFCVYKNQTTVFSYCYTEGKNNFSRFFLISVWKVLINDTLCFHGFFLESVMAWTANCWQYNSYKCTPFSLWSNEVGGRIPEEHTSQTQ